MLERLRLAPSMDAKIRVYGFAPCVLKPDLAPLCGAAQVYMLAVVAALQRSGDFSNQQDLTVLVPPYDPADIFLPSYAAAAAPERADEAAPLPAAAAAARCARVVYACLRDLLPCACLACCSPLRLHGRLCCSPLSLGEAAARIRQA